MWGHFSEEYFLECLGDIKVKANEGYNPGEPGYIDSWEYWHHTKRARLLETIKTFVPQGLERVLVRIEG